MDDALREYLEVTGRAMKTHKRNTAVALMDYQFTVRAALERYHTRTAGDYAALDFAIHQARAVYGPHWKSALVQGRD